MTEQSSSLQNDAGQTATLRRVVRFALQPRLPEPIGRFTPAAFRDVARLYGIDMVLMGLVLACFLVAGTTGYDMPSNEIAEIDLDFAWIAVIVMGAPLSEELAFRGWLSGRLGALIGAPIAALGIFLVLGWVLEPAYPEMALGGAILVAIGAGLAYWLRNRGPYRWFGWAFPLLFWLSVVGFAAIHLGNYEDSGRILWPLVIPQFLAGILFGYARLAHGLPASMLLHALHNGTFMALVVVGEKIGGAG